MTYSLRDKTDLLRAFSILTVVISHTSLFYHQLPVGYGHSVLALFFILSGYGNYHSMSNVQDTKKMWYFFFVKRAFRIYPLYWLGYSISLIKNDFNVLTFFALDFIRPSYAWFVPAVVLCYMFCPGLFYLLRKLGSIKYLLVVLTLFILENVLFNYIGLAKEIAFAYRHFYLNGVFLFALGLAIPALPTQYVHSTPIIPFVFFLCAAHFTTDWMHINSEFDYFFGAMLIVSSFVFTLAFLNYSIPIRKSKIVGFIKRIGAYSFSIYILHVYLIRAVQIINPWRDIIVTNYILFAVMFPVFAFLCILFEKRLNYFAALGYKHIATKVTHIHSR